MSSIGQLWDVESKKFVKWPRPLGMMEVKIEEYKYIPLSSRKLDLVKCLSSIVGISKCCNAHWHVYSANEGTSFYMCNKCNQACDLK